MNRFLHNCKKIYIYIYIKHISIEPTCSSIWIIKNLRYSNIRHLNRSKNVMRDYHDLAHKLRISLSTHGGSTDIRQVARTYLVESRGNKVKSRELYYLCLLISWYLILQFHLIWNRVMIYSYQVQRHVTTEENKARKALALDMHLQLERMWRHKKKSLQRT